MHSTKIKIIHAVFHRKPDNPDQDSKEVFYESNFQCYYSYTNWLDNPATK